MIHGWQSQCVRIGDLLFAWVLTCPRDLGVLLLGVVLGFVLLCIRRLTVDRSRLRQLDQDACRLRDLIRLARLQRNEADLKRFRATQRLVRVHRVRVEFVSICASVLILSAVMTWGQRRLNHLSLQTAAPVTFIVRLPPSTAGEIIHLVPQEGLTSQSGWVRMISTELESGVPVGKASWTLNLIPAESPPLAIVVRFGSESVEHPLWLADRPYFEPKLRHSGILESEVVAKPYQPFGWIPAHVTPGLSGWSCVLMLATSGVYFGLRDRRA